MIDHYHDLPEQLFLVPAALRKYNRGGMLQAFLDSPSQPFMCSTSQKNRYGVAAGTRIPVAVGYAGGGRAHAASPDALFRPPTGEPHTFGDPRGCYANTGHGVSCLDFEMPLYKGLAVARTAHPLRHFVARHMGGWVSEEQLGRSVVCLNGIFATSRVNVLRYPKELYERLLNQTDVADASEAVHMIERLAQVVFGAATLDGGTILVRNETKFKG